MWSPYCNIWTVFFFQIEDVAEGAVKPPPNKIPIFFFGTHETYVSQGFNEYLVVNDGK